MAGFAFVDRASFLRYDGTATQEADLAGIFELLGISKRAVPTETIGTARDFGSQISEGAGTFDSAASIGTPTGPQRFDEYQRVLRDVSIVGAGARLFLNLIANAVWTCNPPDGLNDQDTAKAQEYADAAYAAMFGMTTSWSSVVRKTAAFRLNGFSVQEWTAKKNPDGSIGLLDIEHRPQKTIIRWQRDQGGTVTGVVQRVTGRADVELPRLKIVYAVDDVMTDSPEGLGLFAQSIKTADRLKTFLELEEIGYTTDLRGVPVARAPLKELRDEVIDSGPEGSPARAAAESRRVELLRPLRDWLNKRVRNASSGMLMSSDTYQSVGVDKSKTPSNVSKWDLSLLTGDSTSFEPVASAIIRMTQELARIFGVEHLLLGADGGGSLALAKSKVGTFYLTVTSTLLDLCEIYDRDVIKPLGELNGWPEELWPEMCVNEISDRKIGEVMDALEGLARAGAPIMPDDPAVGEIYDLLGLTRPPERGDEMDLSLNPARNDPTPVDPNDPVGPTPEGQVAKVRVLRSRRNMAKRRVTARQYGDTGFRKSGGIHG